MRIKAVVFDLDGTLADTIPLTVFSIKEVVKKYTGKELTDEDVLNEFGPIDTEIVKKLTGEINTEVCVEDYVKHFSDNYEKFVENIDGITELIKYLKRENYRLGLFTGRGRRVAEIILEKLRLRNYFDEIMAGEDSSKPKPDPEGILKILDRLKVRPEESIYVGDFESDIQASRSAGALSVLALWTPSASHELKKHNPDKYFESPYEFISWFEESKKHSLA